MIPNGRVSRELVLLLGIEPLRLLNIESVLLLGTDPLRYRGDNTAYDTPEASLTIEARDTPDASVIIEARDAPDNPESVELRVPFDAPDVPVAKILRECLI